MKTIVIKHIDTPLGSMCMACCDGMLCLLDYADGRHVERHAAILQKRMQAAVVHGNCPCLEDTQKQLSEYFAGKRYDFNIALMLVGSEFEKKVWQALEQVCYGKTMSYKQQAALIGMQRAVRAVANANGSNRICIVLPCHRIVGSDGSLTGYGGGLWRKQWLLDLEAKHAGNQTLCAC
jgi:AraC family transcriptional regulator of adaptative response/methylated-DNA-[protein]-cysteine methyltransferase